MITSSVETITPEIAATYLQHNYGNRSIRRSAVKTLAEAITRGEWRITHQGVAFSDKGRLIDGQHRLSAIVASGRSVQMMVSRGVPDDSFLVLDQHIKRTYADVLEVPRHIAEVSVFAANIIHGTRITSAQVREWIDVVGHEADAINEFCPARVKFLTNVGMRLAAVICILNGSSREYVHSTYRSLALGRAAELPPAGQSLIQQVITGVAGGKTGRGGGRAASLDALMRGRIVFDESRKDTKRIMATDMQTVLEWARTSLSAAAERTAEKEAA